MPLRISRDIARFYPGAQRQHRYRAEQDSLTEILKVPLVGAKVSDTRGKSSETYDRTRLVLSLARCKWPYALTNDFGGTPSETTDELLKLLLRSAIQTRLDDLFHDSDCNYTVG